MTLGRYAPHFDPVELYVLVLLMEKKPMNAGMTRQLAKNWIVENIDAWPGLRAAHLVGGITAMRDADDFPIHKDVDVHLIFDLDSPMLEHKGPFPNILEVSYR